MGMATSKKKKSVLERTPTGFAGLDIPIDASSKPGKRKPLSILKSPSSGPTPKKRKKRVTKVKFNKKLEEVIGVADNWDRKAIAAVVHQCDGCGRYILHTRYAC